MVVFLQETIAEQIQQIMELENLEEACSYLSKEILFYFLSDIKLLVPCTALIEIGYANSWEF